MNSSSRRASALDGARRSRGRLAATAAVTVAALAVSVLPASAAVTAETGTGAARLRVAAHARAGARPVPLSGAHRRQLLDQAAQAVPQTARALRLGSKEKLIPRDVVVDADGTVHTRYERTYAGLPVIGGDLVVHDRAGARSTTYATRAELSLPTTEAKIPAATARKSAMAAARTQASGEAGSDKAPRLVVWAQSGKPTLAWESVVTGVQKDGSPSELRVVTDAASGRVLEKSQQVESAVGNSMYSGQVQIGSTPQADGTHTLVDPQTGHRTLDATTGTAVAFTDDDDVWGDGTAANRQTAAVDAAYGAQTTWDFYRDRFGRDGIAGDGRSSYSQVHYGGGSYANANWQDSCFCMSYGDGSDGQHPWTSLDIAAHEMAHGVTSSTAHLGDQGESAALNEAISDMTAAAVEFYAQSPSERPDYMIAEDVTGKPIRYMDQPSKAGIHPGTGIAPLDYWTPGAKGVEPHMGAGIGDHWFYLLAEGSGAKTIDGVDYNSPTYDGLPVAGIGLTNATDVLYRALTVYMTSTTDYAGARTATLQAAADLYGAQSDAYEAVANAWAGVNVGARFVNHIAVWSLPTEPVVTGQPVSRQIVATSTRPGPLHYAAKGLPKGLVIDPDTGLITGTPTTAKDYSTTITITDAAGDVRQIPLTWTVFESGGNFFINPTIYVIPKWGTVESPLIVTNKKGNGPSDLKVTVDLEHEFSNAQVIDLVAPDGTVLPVKAWGPWVLTPELHQTFTVDASAVPARGTWKLRVQDGTPGFYDLPEGHLLSWSMSF